MLIHRYISQHKINIAWDILGTDIDSKSVQLAQNGVYLRDEIKEIPIAYLGEHWIRGKGEIENFVKARSSIKKHTHFGVENLLLLSPEVLTRKFDIIFCRNVFIYFSSVQVHQITNSLLQCLDPDGYLFVGVSETLRGLKIPIVSKGPSVYVKATRQKAETPSTLGRSLPLPSVITPSTASKPLRVICIDDSPSILAILKKVLTSETGFEVVGTAKNGLEGIQAVQSLKPDLVTLDIHMPEQNGMEYLSKNLSTNHPPVVMVSSVSRENADLALKSLELGAADYVEKPSLSSLSERAEEIRAKLRCAARSRTLRHVPKVDKQFQRTQKITRPEKAFRIICTGISDRKSLAFFLSSLDSPQPPQVVFFEGCESALESITKDMVAHVQGVAIKLLESTVLENNTVYVADMARWFSKIKDAFQSRNTSIVVIGEALPLTVRMVPQWPSAHVVLEELIETGTQAQSLREKASERLPLASLPYTSIRYLADKEGPV
jgi:chemotaxis protein methyltransferase CheR